MGKKIIFEIPEDVHTQLKLYCVKNKTTITSEVTGLICGLLDNAMETSEEGQIKVVAKNHPRKTEKFNEEKIRENLGLKERPTIIKVVY